MEDGLEILIYLAFLIISIIGGVIKNHNKKKEDERRRARQAENTRRETVAPMPPVGGPVETTNPFEEFLRRQLEQYEEPEEYFPGNIPEEQTAEFEPAPTMQYKAEEPTTMDKAFEFEGAAAFESTSNAMIVDHINVADVHDNGEIKDLEAFQYDAIEDDDITAMQEEIANFEASKAVVYSEILKHPVY
ncbi:MAG: hypothetical protein JXB34_14165 [Bacteroidales bacterium]|nr:hypothetical protein [Bacteroidales bacterium]